MYRVGPNHSIGFDALPYHIVPEAMHAAHATAAQLLAKTVSTFPTRKMKYNAKDGRQLRWKIPAMQPTNPAAM